jgi:hypothetical protein
MVPTEYGPICVSNGKYERRSSQHKIRKKKMLQLYSQILQVKLRGRLSRKQLRKSFRAHKNSWVRTTSPTDHISFFIQSLIHSFHLSLYTYFGSHNKERQSPIIGLILVRRSHGSSGRYPRFETFEINFETQILKQSITVDTALRILVNDSNQYT